MIFANSRPFLQDNPAAAPSYFQAQGNSDAARYGAQGQAIASANNALGQMQSTLYAQPANFANVYGNMYGAYAGGLGNLANAMSNERGNLYGANAMAEAARQGALGNIASAGLGAYGSASNAAMNAWAQNQNAYNQSLAGMQMANQGALGNVGVSRNNALGGLGAAYGQLGRAEAGAQALGSLGGMLGGSGGGGSFNAYGTSGPIASGQYGGGMSGGGGGGGYGGGGTSSALSGLAGLRQDLMSPDITNALQSGNSDAMNRLDNQHYSSRGMPSQMLGQSLSGLMALSAQNAGSIGAGMDQFYGNQTRAGDQFMDYMGGLRGDMASGFDQGGRQVQGMWDASLGKTAFQTPAERLAQEREAQLMQRDYRRDDDLSRYRNILADPGREPLSPNATYGEQVAYGFNQRNLARSQAEARRRLRQMGAM